MRGCSRRRQASPRAGSGPLQADEEYGLMDIVSSIPPHVCIIQLSGERELTEVCGGQRGRVCGGRTLHVRAQLEDQAVDVPNMQPRGTSLAQDLYDAG